MKMYLFTSGSEKFPPSKLSINMQRLLSFCGAAFPYLAEIKSYMKKNLKESQCYALF